MARRFYEKDGNLNDLKGRTVAIIGYGSQGHAHALNLRDSGLDVVVGLYPGSKSWAKAEAAGLKVMNVSDAAKAAQTLMILLPDHIQADLYNNEIAPHMTAGKTLMFAHGFNIHFGAITPPADIDVTMVAPKAPGHRVRELYTEGVGVPALVAVHQNATGQALERALAYALAMGCLKAGVIETNFREETESDLFGEQAVLCGGTAELIRAGFQTLVDAGYAPEIAYFECLHELKLIVDLIQEGGLSYMRYSISDTAEYGDYTRGPRIVTEQTRAEMKKILSEIQLGEFAKQWIGENKSGRKNFLALHHARLTAFGSTRFAKNPVEEDRNVRALVEAGTPVVSIFGKTWDLHVKRALGITEEENLTLISETVKYLRDHGKEVVYDAEHFFDGYAANPDYAFRTLETAQQAGASVLCLCDTNGGTLTGRLVEIVSEVRKRFDGVIGIHTHNDSDVAVANS